MNEDWITIVSSTMLDSHCGDYGPYTLAKALEGTYWWNHNVAHEHWFILDLIEEYTISKFRGRSITAKDPTKVDIYISNDKDNFGVPVLSDLAGWQDKDTWTEYAVDPPKSGRYVKVVIKATEDGTPGEINWGKISSPYMSIFGIYGEIPPNPYPTGLLKKGLVSAYHCFMSAYIRARLAGYDPLKLPDGTVF